MNVGKCPYCDGSVIMEKKLVQGKSTKVYSCENRKVITEDGELFEQVGSCSFRIWGNSLLKYGKRGIGFKEVRELLQDGTIVVTLHSKQGFEYKKYLITHVEYGVQVLFSDEVEEDLSA
ncbi:MAG: hypothetical protein GQ570_04525 [Helicobacteraceae bacterium]|nr:hypothetical protein [Helicobacteraceae bacterium]